MSYWFKMHFKEIKETDVLDYCIQLANGCKQNSEEILKKNIFYIPSIRFDMDILLDKSEYRRTWQEADRNWLYILFSIKFVYWADKKLLGIVGNIPESVERSLKTIEFQNSADQDYEYECWQGINYFNKIVRIFRNADAGSIAAQSEYSKEDIIEDIDYYRKSAIYKEIYDSLELDFWLYNEPGNFKVFSIQAINNTEEYFKLANRLEVVRQDYLKDSE